MQCTYVFTGKPSHVQNSFIPGLLLFCREGAWVRGYPNANRVVSEELLVLILSDIHSKYPHTQGPPLQKIFEGEKPGYKATFKD